MAEDIKCGHNICNCVVVDEAQYCSESCQEANSNDATDEPCDCGCAGCTQASS